MITIRDARAGEVDAIRELVVDAYRDYAVTLGQDSWMRMEASLRDVEHWAENGTLIVAADGDALLGSVAYVPPGKSDPSLYDPVWASLRVLAVGLGARGQGLGRRLTEECIRRARRDGAAVIALHTSEFMEVARPMYERLGFTVDHTMDRPGPRYWVYTLALTQPSSSWRQGG